jgi:monofunctional biosynthetic peptidoglycan transglycosylase
MNDPRPRIAPSVTPGVTVTRSEDAAWPDEAASAPPRRSGWRRIKLTLLWTFLVLFLLALVPPASVLWLRWNPPPTTSFMMRSEVQPVAYHWVPKDQIPEALRRAVVAAEDQKFWTHWGFDFLAIAEALEHNEKSRKKRGASTITQQTAKNLYLWPSRSWLRKGLEVSFTLLLEWLWPKERILEVYLNVAEFGPGIYGAEAAAQKFFGKPAAKMNAAECAQLAAVLPNPRKWRADRPGPYVQSRVDWILRHIGEPTRFSTFPDADTEEPVEPGLDLPEEEGEEPAPDNGAAPAAETPSTEVLEGAPAVEPAPAETPAETPVEPSADASYQPEQPAEPAPEPQQDPAPRY